MTREDQLLQGKFKQIPFKVRKETITQIGQKRVIHDYFNSGGRYAEAQGRVPLEFSVDIYFSGQDWQAQFREFRAAIEDAAAGTLILPTFGVFTSIVAMPASADADQTGVGEIKMAVTFTETIEKPAPTDVFSTSEDVSAQAQITRNELSASFEDTWESPSTLNNLTTASLDMKTLAGDVRTVTDAVRDALNFVRRVDANLRQAANLARLLFSPATPIGYLQNLAATVVGTGSFRTFKRIATIGTRQPNAMNDVNDEVRPTPAGTVEAEPTGPVPDTEILVWDDDTAERRERNANRYSAVNVFRIAGLVGMYESAAEQVFTTTDEIDNVQALLDLYYSLLVENDESQVLYPDVKVDLDRLRGLTDRVLLSRRQNAFTVIEIDIEKYTPTTLLAYDLYGERIQNQAQLQFLADLIKGLNIQQPAHRLIGTVRVLEIR